MKGHGLCLALVVVVVLAACSAGDEPTAEAEAPPGPQAKGIEGIVAADGTSLTVETDLLPVEGSTGSCAVEIDPWVEENAEDVYVYVGYESEAGPTFDGCEVASRTITVELREPIGTRRVRDALSAIFWQDGGAWVGCGHVVMTCVPGPATCDNLPDSVANFDVPRGTGADVHGCDGSFAVVDADMGRRDCPAGGECRRVDRLFLAVQDEEWAVVGRGRAAGCDVIADHAPDFPTAMCEGLPAP